MIVAVVHAKGSSDRVFAKNVQPLGSVPLFVHSIRNALAAKLVDEVVIDSEDREILDIGHEFGARKLVRPSHLANNVTTGDNLALWQANSLKSADIIVQVVPTSPFIEPETIDYAIEKMLSENVDSVVGCREDVFYEWKDGKPAYRIGGRLPNSQELKPIIYETTGLYVMKSEAVLRTQLRVNPKSCLPVMLSKIEAIDINYDEDLEIARAIHAYKYRHEIY